MALGSADTAANLARRPLLSGEDAPWLDQLRTTLRRTLVYALELEVGLLRQRGDLYEELRLAEEAISLEPFRETAHVHLMFVHSEAGNRAEALRAYERCRHLLASELGIDPSAKTSAAYRQLLHADE